MHTIQDRGNPPNQVVEDLSVTVGDVNDQNPAFLLNDYFAEVHENLTFVCSCMDQFSVYTIY